MKKRQGSGRFPHASATGPCGDLVPFPATVVTTLADLGLTDHEIARYFSTDPARITRIRLESAPELQLPSVTGRILDFDWPRPASWA